MTFLWAECTKGRAPPCGCVRARVGECLCDEGLSEKSRLVEFVFCSLYTRSQLRDKTDKSTPPLLLLTYPSLFPPPLCLLFILSSLPLPFTELLLGLTFVLEMTFQWCELFNNIKTAAATKSQTQRTMFSSRLSQPSQNALFTLEGINPKGCFWGHKVMHILQLPTAFVMYQERCIGKDTSSAIVLELETCLVDWHKCSLEERKQDIVITECCLSLHVARWLRYKKATTSKMDEKSFIRADVRVKDKWASSANG